jgi:3D-(3,5/4)-trihydroxycyclohexane-1,2-dione acylhydrolase (decyclizing)
VIVAGGGVHYAGACEALAAFVTAHGIPWSRRKGQFRPALGSCVEFRPGGRDRRPARQHPLRRGRCRDRCRHPLAGLHHRQPGTVLATAAAPRVGECGHLGRAPARRRAALRRRARRVGRARGGAGRRSGAPPPEGPKAAWVAVVNPQSEASADSKALPTDQRITGSAQPASGA